MASNVGGKRFCLLVIMERKWLSGSEIYDAFRLYRQCTRNGFSILFQHVQIGFLAL